MHTICRGDRQTVVFAGDLIPGMPWVHLPITMGYDRYPELLIDEKAKLYENVLTGNWWVFFTHDPNVVMTHVRQDFKGRFEPVEPVPEAAKLTI
jgi:glyoxylase-like metal-dependent hydrolase (beta-lactamase superfamily II)